MRTTGLALLTCAALIAAPTATRADAQADALLEKVAAATKAAATLTGDLEMNAQVPGREIKTTGTVKLKKPNLARIELTGQMGQTIVSDGKTLWMVAPGGEQYQKRDADPQGKNINALWAFPVSYFFNPGTKLPGIAPDAETRFAGTETLDGQVYRVIEVTTQKPAGSLKMYVGPDNLFRRVVIEAKQGDETAKYEATLKNVEVGKPMTTASFAYTPPKTAKLYEPPDFNAKLIAVGKKAPAFALPSPSGGQVSLENTLKDKKAVLINFWFYN